MKKLLRYAFFLAFTTAQAQDAWTPTAARSDNFTPLASRYATFALASDLLTQQLSAAPPEGTSTAPVTVALPTPDGQTQTFRVVYSPIMAPALAAKYPQIRTYAVVGGETPGVRGRIDYTSQGFHAMIRTPDGTIFVDPAADLYQVYYRHDAVPGAEPPMVCETDAPKSAGLDPDATDAPTATQGFPSDGQLRTYRLALSCTGEYAQFHGGTTVGALSAMVTSMNRVNGIYETDVAARMVLVPNNDTLVFLNPSTDPFNNFSGGALLGQNQAVCDARIGNSNYDIGHVFSTGGGGVASLGSLCESGNKARGVTGQPSPTGDPFDVDYVAHEIGHQFDALHTQNNPCNRSGSAAYEPGSASTIMGYAGICSPNLQNNSDPYFHTHSVQQMLNHIQSTDCAALTDIGNAAPVVNAGDDYVIPVETAFVLDGSATDDGPSELLTYCWEQYDLGPAGPPQNPVGNAPIFRSFLPDTATARFFPRLSDLADNNLVVGERLPTYARNLTFRLTVRDNDPAGGGVAFDATTVTVTEESGPFLVEAPNDGSEEWLAGGVADVAWDVANTDAAPVNCAAVDIFFSSDGGDTYPITLATNVPNTGIATLILPQDLPLTATARVMVKGAGNVFFDISDADFTVLQPSAPTLALFAANPFVQLCAGQSDTLELVVLPLAGYDQPVILSATNLPDGVTVEFSENDFTAPDTLSVFVNTEATATGGEYDLTVNDAAAGATLSIALRLFDGEPAAPTALAATVGAVDFLSWTAVPTATSYAVELAYDADFNLVFATFEDIPGTDFDLPALESGVTYYWRVRGTNDCGSGPFAEGDGFSLGEDLCETVSSTNVPLTISSGPPNTVTSTLEYPTGGTISDVNVTELRGTHSYVGDLTVDLSSPEGTRVRLFSNVCGTLENFDVAFDDDATVSTLPCPPTDGGTYAPVESLGDFNNENPAGTWTLRVIDGAGQDGGQLNAWAIEVCTPQSFLVGPTALDATLTDATTALLTWTEDLEGEASYRIERTDSLGAPFELIGTTLGDITEFIDTDLEAEREYFYRVQAVIVDSTNELSAYSNVDSVSTLVTSLPTPSWQAAWRVYPNPSKDVFRVSGLRGPATVTVLDRLGRVVHQRSGYTAGDALDLRHLPAGVYFLRAVGKQTNGVRKIWKQ